MPISSKRPWAFSKLRSDKLAALGWKPINRATKWARDEGWREDHTEGCNEAKDKYLVSCDCALCGGTMEVVTEEQKNIVRELARQYHLAHGECEARERERQHAMYTTLLSSSR